MVGSQFLRLREADRRLVQGGHVVAAGGQVDRIAALTLAQEANLAVTDVAARADVFHKVGDVGAAIARLFHAHGAALVLADIEPGPLAATRAIAAGEGAQHLFARGRRDARDRRSDRGAGGCGRRGRASA